MFAAVAVQLAQALTGNCEVGNFIAGSGSRAKCTRCPPCPPGTKVQTACTGTASTVDQVCNACPACPSGEIVVRPCSPERATPICSRPATPPTPPNSTNATNWTLVSPPVVTITGPGGAAGEQDRHRGFAMVHIGGDFPVAMTRGTAAAPPLEPNCSIASQVVRVPYSAVLPFGAGDLDYVINATSCPPAGTPNLLYGDRYANNRTKVTPGNITTSTYKLPIGDPQPNSTFVDTFRRNVAFNLGVEIERVTAYARLVNDTNATTTTARRLLTQQQWEMVVEVIAIDTAQSGAFQVLILNGSALSDAATNTFPIIVVVVPVTTTPAPTSSAGRVGTTFAVAAMLAMLVAVVV